MQSLAVSALQLSPTDPADKPYGNPADKPDGNFSSFFSSCTNMSYAPYCTTSQRRHCLLVVLHIFTQLIVESHALPPCLSSIPACTVMDKRVLIVGL